MTHRMRQGPGAWVLGEGSLGGWDSVQKLEGGARGRTRFWDPELPVLRPAGSLVLGVVEPGMRRPLVAIQQTAVRPALPAMPVLSLLRAPAPLPCVPACPSHLSQALAPSKTPDPGSRSIGLMYLMRALAM